MTEPHSLRCETCNVVRCRYNPKNEDEGILLGYSWVQWHVDEFGCASHSSNTSAEKVLEDVELAIRAVAINDPDIRTRYSLHLVDCLNILNKVREELRQEKTT